jgi:hypothetical protein
MTQSDKELKTSPKLKPFCSFSQDGNSKHCSARDRAQMFYASVLFQIHEKIINKIGLTMVLCSVNLLLDNNCQKYFYLTLIIFLWREEKHYQDFSSFFPHSPPFYNVWEPFYTDASRS